MKSQLKKLISIFACVCLLLTAIIIPASAAETSATISFATTDARISQDANSQVWSANGITVTNNKGASTSNVADYYNPVRFYKNSDVVIEYSGMTKIEIDVSGIPAKNQNAWVNSCSDATISDGIVTITLAAPADSYSITLTDNQARANSITVYAATTGGEGDDETPDVPVADSTLSIADAAALGAGMTHNTTTEGKYYVEGVIKSVANTMYGNMTIEDAEGNSLYIYGTYDADGTNRYDAMETKPVAGDTVKLYGVIGNYNGAQMKNGWIVEHTPATTPGEGEGGEGGDETPDVPAADSTLSIADAAALGAGMTHNTTTEGKYYVEGVIKSVANTMYGNMTIEDAEGNSLYIYGTYDADGTNRYDAMETKPVAGDTVKLYGVIGNYNGAQMKNGWIVEHTPATTPGEGEGGEGGEVEPPVNNDPEADSELTITEVIELGLSKEHDTFTEGKYYVTAIIKEVYNPQYGNMYLVDEDGNQITLYGSYNEDGTVSYKDMETKPIAGDTITVYGIVGQYDGTPQVKNGWIVDHISSGAEAPVAPDNAEDILAAAEALEPGSTLPYVATLTGTVVSIDTEYSEQYGNVTVTIEVEGTDGKTIQCYRLKAAEGEDAAALAVDDKITVTGYIINYNGTIQFNSGSTFVTATADDNIGDDNTTGGTTGGTTTGGTTTGGTTTDTNTGAGTTTDTTSPVTGDTVGSCVAMAIAAAAVVLYTSKKRA